MAYFKIGDQVKLSGKFLRSTRMAWPYSGIVSSVVNPGENCEYCQINWNTPEQSIPRKTLSKNLILKSRVQFEAV